MKKRTICLATNNAHKVEELQQMLGDRFELLTLTDIGCFDEIPESSDSLTDNAIEKATYVFDKYGVDCIADDSGLEVDALQGAPGAYSARYAGPERSHEKNMDLLLRNLNDVNQRSARFRTVIALLIGGTLHTFEGIVDGEIIREKRGNQGFGYDPIFVPAGYERTFAEMSMEEKNPISHRGRAVEKLLHFLTP